MIKFYSSQRCSCTFCRLFQLLETSTAGVLGLQYMRLWELPLLIALSCIMGVFGSLFIALNSAVVFRARRYLVPHNSPVRYSTPFCMPCHFALVTHFPCSSVGHMQLTTAVRTLLCSFSCRNPLNHVPLARDICCCLTEYIKNLNTAQTQNLLSWLSFGLMCPKYM